MSARINLLQLILLPHVHLAAHCARVIRILALAEAHAEHSLYVLNVAEYSLLLLQRVANQVPEADLLHTAAHQAVRVLFEQVELQVEDFLLMSRRLGQELAPFPVPDADRRVLIYATRSQSLSNLKARKKIIFSSL